MSILPGFLLSFAIAIVSYLLNRFIFHSLGSATIAILLGIILGNLYFKQVTLFAETLAENPSFLPINKTKIIVEIICI
ncbi:putative sulfate exporter family transporter, partial [Lactococcus lactis]